MLGKMLMTFLMSALASGAFFCQTTIYGKTGEQHEDSNCQWFVTNCPVHGMSSHGINGVGSPTKIAPWFCFFPIFFVLFKDDIKPLSNTGSITPPILTSMQDVVHCRKQCMFLSMETLGVWHHILYRVVSQDHESWFWKQVPIPLYLHIYLPVWDYWICALATQEWTKNIHPNAPTSKDCMTWHDNIVSVWWDIRLWCDHLNRAFSVG